MTATGGSATINGILFQLLGTLARAASLQLEAIRNDETANRVLLRVEPSGGGGDLQIHFPQKRVIEQWKAKTGGGTWSLRQVSEDVLVDLYRAVDDANLCPDDEYLFVTEGRRGLWGEAEAFFAELGKVAPPADILTELDDDEQIEFFPNETLTKRKFFLQLARVVSSPARFQGEAPALTHRKLWHLLGRFRIVEQLRPEQLTIQIDDLLRDIVDVNDEVAATRERLFGWLMTLAGKGEVTFTPAELLNRAGLQARSFRAEGLLQTILRDRLEHQITADVNYDRDIDVRPSPEFRDGCNALVVSGESGQGKSWVLARLAWQEFAAGSLAVWTQSRGDFEDDLDAISREVWQRGLDHDSDLPLDRVAARRQSVFPQGDRPWLTVCIDDVQSADEARRLIRQDWTAWKIRLAMTVPREIAAALIATEDNNRFGVFHVADFTVAELQSALQRRGSDWATIPSDVRETLRRPLLCHLYCQIAAIADRNWRPTSEYQLYDRCWQRVIHGRVQPNHPADAVSLGNIAANLVLAAEPTYPWPIESLLAAGIDEAALKRLQAIGWLKIDTSGLVEVWHDRLLNYAAAAGLVRLRKAGLRTTTELVDAIKPLWSAFSTRLRGRLRYVPADVLWLLCGEQTDSAPRADVISLFEAKENGSDGGHDLQTFYEDLVPTLGERVIPFLIERLRVTRSDHWNPYPRYIATALARIGRTARSAIEARIPELLQDLLPEMQETGVLLSSVFPIESALEPLWNIHKHNHSNRDQQHALNARWRGSDHEESFDALSRGVNAHSNWLIAKIQDADPACEPVSQLAFLAATLENSDALSVWHKVRALLFEKVLAPNRRSLASCVLHFRDTSAVEQLEAWISAEDDWLAPTAFVALTATAPDRALSALDRIDVTKVLLFHGEWLDELLHQRLTETQRALIRRFGHSPDLLYESLDLFAGHEHQLESATVNYLLDTLERAADEFLECTTPQRSPNHFRWGLNSIAKIATPQGLSCFASRTGSSLEAKITAIALRWLENEPETLIEEIANIESVLLKIGGSGIQQLINAQLSHASDYVRDPALARCPMLTDSVTIAQLECIATNEQLADARPRPLPMDQAAALLWLAASGRNGAVVQAILRWGNGVVRDRLPDIREEAGPLTDEELKPAVEAFSTRSATERRHAVCVFGLSGRRDCIPSVREFLEGQSVGSDAAIDAMLALLHLRDNSEESARILEKHLLCTKWDYARHALNALSVNGSPVAQDILERAFIDGAAGIQSHRWSIAAQLCRDSERRKRLVPQIWEKMKGAQDYWGSNASECYELVTELPDPEVREFLWRKATPVHTSYDSPDARAAAISALAKLDGEAAFLAAEAELADEHVTDAITKTLLRIDSARAAARLCADFAKERDTAKRWRIARALRLADEPDEARRLLSDQIESESARERKSACELCGWMGIGFVEEKLRRAALEDLNSDVRAAARHSLARQARETIAQELAREIATAPPIRQWAIAFSIVDLVDPYLLLRLEKPVPFNRIMSKLPAAMLLRVNAKLRDHIRKLDDKAKDHDRRSERSFASRVEH